MDLRQTWMQRNVSADVLLGYKAFSCGGFDGSICVLLLVLTWALIRIGHDMTSD